MKNVIKISTDKSKLNIELIHEFLTSSYWAKGRSIDDVKKSIKHSYCFGIYLDNKQIGFARVVSDFTIFAYLLDVFILKDFRGKGYSKLLLQKIFKDRKLAQVKKWKLATKDAHGLYAKFGFREIKRPDHLMEKV